MLQTDAIFLSPRVRVAESPTGIRHIDTCEKWMTGGTGQIEVAKDIVETKEGGSCFTKCSNSPGPT